MITVTHLSGKKIALFGLGGSGLVSAHALIKGGARVTAFDDNPERVIIAQSQGIPTGDFRQCDFSEFDELVLAPGVPLTHPKPHWTAELAKANGVAIIGDIELFCRERELVAPHSKLVAITGTNGKSTTTALVAHLLDHAGRKVEMGGNIGRAVLDFDPLDDGFIYVVEISSYQIDLAPELKPDIGILLNISPDHLDRHGTMENYAAIKERMVQNSGSTIIGVDDEYCRAIADRLAHKSNALTRVSVNETLENGIFAKKRNIIQNSNGISEKVADLVDNGSLRGNHNAQNASVAWQACKELGLNSSEIQSGLNDFPGLVDRMEELGRVGNTLIVNDSKGTNADATDMALGSFTDIYWIAGGLAKEGGIETLRHHFPHIIKAYLIGEAAPNFAGILGDDVAFEISGTLDKALTRAVDDAKDYKGDEAVILMSPACASFDQFPSYAVRGEKFRALVNNIDGFVARASG